MLNIHSLLLVMVVTGWCLACTNAELGQGPDVTSDNAAQINIPPASVHESNDTTTLKPEEAMHNTVRFSLRGEQPLRSTEEVNPNTLGHDEQDQSIWDPSAIFTYVGVVGAFALVVFVVTRTVYWIKAPARTQSQDGDEERESALPSSIPRKSRVRI